MNSTWDLFKLEPDGIRPFGIKISLSWAQICALLWLIQEHKVGTVIELGVLEGGLGSLVLSMYDPRPRYVGVEFNQQNIDGRINGRLNNNDLMIYGDCFNPDTFTSVMRAINISLKPVLLFCDNGNKPKEIKMYHSLIRPGDILVTHDWETEVQEDDIMFLLEDESFECNRVFLYQLKLPTFIKKR